MKLKITLSLFIMIMTVSSSFASFPVQRVSSTEEISVIEEEVNEEELYSPAAAGQKSQGIALILWWLLGWPFAAHRWYLGSPWYWNVLFIITFGGFGIWAIIDLIGILTGSYEPRNGSYKSDFF